jgi:hypothetical protein
MPVRKIIPVIISIVFFSCIKQVDVGMRNEKPKLVVEGNITTDTIPYTVKLTYSGQVLHADSVPDQYLEKDAKVTISDDLGNSTVLLYTHQGIYETTDPSYIGKAGRSYSVTVVLKDGKKYISTPEKMKAPVPVDSIMVRYNSYFDFNAPSRMEVFINTRDPAQEENYYRWTFNTWVGRETPGIGCGFGCVLYQYCFQHYIDNEVRILSDASINGNEIRNQKVGFCYIFTYFNPYIDIGQVSLTREAYQFWEAYQGQQTRTGGILDPLPAAIKGNVYNATDPNDFALGYFSAASVTHRKAILIPFSITPYLLQLSATEFIPKKSVACFEYFENTLSYPPPPAPQYPPPHGWENAEQIKVYWYIKQDPFLLFKCKCKIPATRVFSPGTTGGNRYILFAIHFVRGRCGKASCRKLVLPNLLTGFFIKGPDAFIPGGGDKDKAAGSYQGAAIAFCAG